MHLSAYASATTVLREFAFRQLSFFENSGRDWYQVDFASVFAFCMIIKSYLSLYFIQHCLICRPGDSTVSEDARSELKTVAILALAQLDALTTWLDLLYNLG
jgi:hypothetical protein